MASLAIWKLLKAAQVLLEDILHESLEITLLPAYASQGPSCCSCPPLSFAKGSFRHAAGAKTGHAVQHRGCQNKRVVTLCSLWAIFLGRLHKPAKLIWGTTYGPRAILLEQALEKVHCKMQFL